jgi:glycosyltransferase involved in cell wall biosynthesis
VSLSVAIVVPELHRYSAIGRHVLGFARSLSPRARIFCQKLSFLPKTKDPPISVLRDFAQLNHELESAAVVFWHYGGEHEIFSNLKRRKAKQVLVYHGVTPPEFLESGSIDHLASERAIKAIDGHLSSVDELWTDSEASLGDLRLLTTKTLPKWRLNRLFDLQLYNGPSQTLEQSVSPELEILYAGRIVPSKGLERLSALGEWIRARKLGARLKIVGAPFSAAYQGQLQRMLEHSWAPGAVEFLGVISTEALCESYLKSDVFVLPTLHEGFGIPVVEAASFGCQMLLSDLPALRETCARMRLESEQVTFVSDWSGPGLDRSNADSLFKKRARFLRPRSELFVASFDQNPETFVKSVAAEWGLELKATDEQLTSTQHSMPWPLQAKLKLKDFLNRP